MFRRKKGRGGSWEEGRLEERRLMGRGVQGREDFVR
jgi:hypothetical protein